MSGAERKKKVQKEETDYRLKENARLKELKEKSQEKASPLEIQRKKMMNRNHNRASRLRKKLEAQSPQPEFYLNGVGFKSPQSLGKAVSKIREKLPDSPLKRQQTIQGVGAAFGFKLLKSMNNKLHPNKGLSAEEKDTVVDFFFRTDIVYTSPGMKEEMTVWTDDGEKQRLRKYYLTVMHLAFKK